MIETQPDGTRVLQRRQLDAIVACRGLFGPELLAQWRAVDRALTAFVGVHDGMTVDEVDGFLHDLGASQGTLASFSDERVLETIRGKDYGRQRILSDPIIKPRNAPRFETHSSFSLFGQRYALDSHLLHLVTEDRVQGRQLPDPLDVAFGVFANDHAAALLGTDLERLPDYPQALIAARDLVDAHTESYWNSSLYTIWLWTLRARPRTCRHGRHRSEYCAPSPGPGEC